VRQLGETATASSLAAKLWRFGPIAHSSARFLLGLLAVGHLAIGYWLLAIGYSRSDGYWLFAPRASANYIAPLKTLGFLSFFFIISGWPLFAGPVQFAGGDGSSVESAVVIRGAKNEKDGIAAEHHYLSQHFGSWFLKRQVLVNQKGRVYDQMEITDQNGKQRAVFFDITDFFGK
jgi:hypothetical protein